MSIPIPIPPIPTPPPLPIPVPQPPPIPQPGPFLSFTFLSPFPAPNTLGSTAFSTSIIQSTSVGTSNGQPYTTTVQATTAVPVTSAPVNSGPFSRVTVVSSIIGGAALVALGVIALILWFIIRRRRRNRRERTFNIDFDPSDPRNNIYGNGNATGTIHPITTPGHVFAPEMKQHHYQSRDYDPGWHGSTAHGTSSGHEKGKR